MNNNHIIYNFRIAQHASYKGCIQQSYTVIIKPILLVFSFTDIPVNLFIDQLLLNYLQTLIFNWLSTLSMQPCHYVPEASDFNEQSFIDQACFVKMAGYWPHSFFVFLWTKMKSRSIKHTHTHTQKLGQYPAILTSHLVNNSYI